MPKINKFKVVLVGDQNVGKTSIISRFIHDSFELSSNPTVGIDFVTKTMQVDGQTLRLQLWDTAGQQRFRSLIPSYVRDADACMVVLDLGVHCSYQNLNKWTDFVRETRGQDGLMFLVGNKSDIEERQITEKQMEEYSEKNEYPYMEVSAKNGTNIQLLFRKISEKLIQSKRQEAGSKQQLGYSSKQAKSSQKTKPVKMQKENIVLNKKEGIKDPNAQSRCQC